MVCFHPCLTQGSVGPSESLVPIHIIPNYWTPMKSPCPMNQFRIITSSVFTLQFREMKSLRKKQNPPWIIRVSFISIISSLKPRPHKPYTLHNPNLLHIIFLIAAFHRHTRDPRQVDQGEIWCTRGVDRQDDGVVHDALVGTWVLQWLQHGFDMASTWLQHKSKPKPWPYYWNNCCINTSSWDPSDLKSVFPTQWTSENAPSNQPLGQFVFRSHLWRRWSWWISCHQPAQRGLRWPKLQHTQ